MLQDNENEQKTLQELILENQRLLSENNQLLKKMQKVNVWSFVLRVIWFLILIGVPFFAYYYLIEPFMASDGSALESGMMWLQNIPGWKQFCLAVVSEV
ncbi:hypothetical protein H6784_05550 [Candidatus Nomurabacteria bacterium]|nr:hypothetical protein [Candidatus Nomurabacteria bacterium]